MTIIEDRLAALETLQLKGGSHSPGKQEFCFNEAAAWLAGEKHSDAPACVSPYLRRYTMRLNDRWDDEKRQTLLPYLVRVIGTGGDGKDEARARIARRALCEDLLPPWLRLAGMEADAAQVEASADISVAELRTLLWKVRDAAWAKRNKRYGALRAAVKSELAKHPVAVADAAADAVAAAAAVAVAVAVAVAAADADAAADAAAAAAAVAAAVAAADAAAVAAAVAVAAAAAAAGKSYDSRYSAAYKAARKYYQDNPIALGAEVADLAAKQQGAALRLLDRLIDANEESA